MIKAISLFAGAGGMDVGFQNAGIDVVWANELDPIAASTYRLNNPGTTLSVGDIKKAKNELAQLKCNIDMVFGGPPCQGFSVAGKMDPEDERSKLVWEFLDVVKMIKPKCFVIENVKALGELERWKPVREEILLRSKKLGYTCFYQVLNAANYGVPQNRERVFFVGLMGKHPNAEVRFENVLASLKQQKVTIRECLEGLPSAGTDGNPLTCTAKITIATKPVLRKSPYAGMLFNGMGRPLDIDSQSNTLPASMGGNKTPIIDNGLLTNPQAENWVIAHHQRVMKGETIPNNYAIPKTLRRITIVEAASIQTFPSHYQFDGKKSAIYRQIGNAVPCNLAEAVAKAVLAIM